MYYPLINSMSKFDIDAQAFINAASISNFTQKKAINTLVISLKSYGIWSKTKAIYPFVGGTATTHKFNLKDPRDLNAAFRLTFLGGWTHNLLAATSNGSNGYADTFFNIQNLNQNNSHLSIYNINNYTSSPLGTIDFGAFDEVIGDGVFIATELVPGLSRGRIFKNPLDYSLTNNTGYYIVNSTTINSKYFINNVIRSTIANSGVFPLTNKNIFIGALNGSYPSPGPSYFANGSYTFASIGDGLSDTEASNYYTAVQAFQTTLGRQI